MPHMSQETSRWQAQNEKRIEKNKKRLKNRKEKQAERRKSKILPTPVRYPGAFSFS